MALSSSSFDPIIYQPPNPAPSLSPTALSPTNGTMHTAKLTNDDIEAVIQAATSASAQASYPAMRPPRDTRTQLFVGNLPYRVRWQDLKDLFRRAGTVLRADVSLAPDNRSRGYGTVLLASAEDAGRAIDMFNGFVWQTRTLEVRHDKMGVSAAGEEFHGVGSGVGVGSALSGGVSFGSNENSSASSSGAATPFPQLQTNVPGSLSRFPSTNAPSPLTFSPPSDDIPSITTNFSNHIALSAKLSSPSANSPLLGPGSAPSPLTAHSPLLSQLTGSAATSSLLPQHTGNGTSLGGERSRNLFVGNLPFHIQWQDLKDLFRQAGTILRADVALGPDGRSRGFGTVSFATEVDAERAVKMFNGYEFNGRVLKVHFDKYAVPSFTALPTVGIHALSAPQSPLPHMHAIHQPTTLNQGLNLAQQILYQQHMQARQQDRIGPGQDRLYAQAPGSLHRSLTDSQASRFLHSADERTPARFASEMQAYGQDQHSLFTRAKSDTIQQLLQESSSLRPPSPQTRMDQHYQTQEDALLHISMPPFRPPYAFDFSPGSPYDLYHLSSGMGQNAEMDQMDFRSGMDAPFSVDIHAEELETFSPAGYTAETTSRPSTSPGPAVSSDPRKQMHSHSQSESYRSVAAHAQGQSQSQTQATSSVTTSPTSTHSSSLHSHPAHPGPISLPPPPPVTAFPIPPPHTLSPVYHPQMSPYGPPMHHHPMMMGMMGMPTPHGLPPITPSMPSFTFLPQPSPGAPPSSTNNPASSESSAPGSGQRESPASTNEAQAQAPAGSYVAHLQHHHGMLSPYSPFSPGVAMSPGAFWGGAGSSGGANPYINPAVGAPVHSGYFPPVPAPVQQQQQQRAEEGYFPPFVSSSRPSGLANELRMDGEASVGDGGSTEGAPTHVPSQNGALNSDGTTATTSMPTTTEVSPREPTPSSKGTSLQTDPSPVRDLTQEIALLGIRPDGCAQQQQQRSQSTGANSSGPASSLELAKPPIVRPDSDPTSASSAASMSPSARLGQGIHGAA